jgi:hypothetical protein
MALSVRAALPPDVCLLSVPSVCNSWLRRHGLIVVVVRCWVHGRCVSVAVCCYSLGTALTQSHTRTPRRRTDTAYGKIGLGICYDMRFAHMALLYGQLGCKLIVYPGAFNTTTGPAHWELLLRSRALDSQVGRETRGACL